MRIETQISVVAPPDCPGCGYLPTHTIASIHMILLPAHHFEHREPVVEEDLHWEKGRNQYLILVWSYSVIQWKNRRNETEISVVAPPDSHGCGYQQAHTIAPINLNLLPALHFEHGGPVDEEDFC